MVRELAAAGERVAAVNRSQEELLRTGGLAVSYFTPVIILLLLTTVAYLTARLQVIRSPLRSVPRVTTCRDCGSLSTTVPPSVSRRWLEPGKFTALTRRPTRRSTGCRCVNYRDS